jgi:hypothetical protein
LPYMTYGAIITFAAEENSAEENSIKDLKI